MSRGGAEPWDVADRFIAAVAAGDEGEASACCNPDAWVAPGDSPARLFRDVTRRGLTLEADTAERDGDRATADALVIHPDRPDSPRRLTFLMLDEGDGFFIEGLALGAIHGGAFLAGAIDARPRPEPADPAALFAQILPEGRVGRRFRLRLEKLVEDGGSWKVVEANQLAGVGRAEMVVRSTPAEGEPSQVWVYLDLDENRVLTEDSFRSWSSYLAEPAAPEPEDDEELVPPDEDGPVA